MGLGTKLKDKFALISNLKNIRHPSLTRLMLFSPQFKTQLSPTEFTFQANYLNSMCDAFLSSKAGENDRDIWTELREMSLDFCTALEARNLEDLQQILSHMFTGTLTYGMAHTDLFISNKSPYGPAYFSERIRDMVLALAEALALKGLDCSKQSSLQDYIAQTNQDLLPFVNAVSNRLGHSIETPDFGNSPIANVGAHALNPDFLRHAYVMHRVQQLGFKKDQPILEIGGGFGCVARYAVLSGFTDYSIIDLPFAMCIQSAFLTATLGDESVSFGISPETPVNLYPSTRKVDIDRPYELVINMASMPEINRPEAIEYLKLIKAKSKFFLSINQEAKNPGKGENSVQQNSVHEMIQQVGGFRLLHRSRYWMEQGTAEELYEIV